MAALSIQKRLSSSQSVAQAATYTEALEIANFKFVSVQMNKTGAGTGTAKLQHSNDGTNWVDVNTTVYPNATAAVGAGAQSVFLTCESAASNIRLSFTEANVGTVSITNVLWNVKLH